MRRGQTHLDHTTLIITSYSSLLIQLHFSIFTPLLHCLIIYIQELRLGDLFCSCTGFVNAGHIIINGILLVFLNFEVLQIIPKEAVGNFWDTLNTILHHKYHHNHPNSGIKQIKPKFATKSEFYYICVFQYACVCVCVCVCHQHLIQIQLLNKDVHIPHC